MPRKLRILVVALLLLVVLAIVWPIVFTAPPVIPPLPNPNGYDDFLKATAVLNGDLGNASTLNHDGVQALISTNTESLRLIRLGLSRRCSLPADSAMANVSGMLVDLQNLKSLARLLIEEGRLAEMDNRNADASRSYVDTIQFGNELSRGGFIINRLVGIACQAMGTSALSKLVPKLKPAEAHPVVIQLEQLDRTEISWDEIARNEKRFARHQLGKGFNPITWVMTRWTTWRSIQRAEMRQQRLVAHLRLLSTELAVRCYQSEQGRAPAALTQLVPKYLQQVPLDPFTGRPLVYRPQGANWLLYSVGEDGSDDGGKPVARSAPGGVAKGDILYDSPY